MDCDRTGRYLRARLDGELAPAHAAEVDHHLERCPACSQEALEAERISRVIRAAVPPPLPRSPRLSPRSVAARVRSLDTDDVTLVAALKRVAAAAALFLVASGLLAAWAISTAAPARADGSMIRGAIAVSDEVPASILDPEHSFLIVVAGR